MLSNSAVPTEKFSIFSGARMAFGEALRGLNDDSRTGLDLSRYQELVVPDKEGLRARHEAGK